MIRDLVRANIAHLTPYSSARNEFTGEAEVYLDANENWQGFVSYTGANRYPDPQAKALRARIEEVLGLKASIPSSAVAATSSSTTSSGSSASRGRIASW